MKIAILDDYQNVALTSADWSPVRALGEITVFNRHLKPVDEAAEALAPFDILCLTRERMAMPAALLNRLPNLKFIAATGPHNRTIDYAVTGARNIPVSHTSGRGTGGYATPELTWGLVLACMRQIPQEDRATKAGAWQTSIGRTLFGRRLGLVGLGRIGGRIAEYGRAFGMEVVAWSPNLTEAKAAEKGAKRVEKEELFATSDVVSLHVVLSERSRGIVGAREIGLMRKDAYLINTSRGPLVDSQALMDALASRRIAGAGLDVFDEEPLPRDHPIRRIDNAILTPHLGYVTEETYRVFYEDTVENILAFAAGRPHRLLTSQESTKAPLAG